MPTTATRLLCLTTAVLALGACRSAPTATPPGATTTGSAPSATSAPAPPRTTAPVAPKTQRPADPPRSEGLDPCDGIRRSAGMGPARMGSHTTAELYLVRVERSACADRVVFRVNGTAGFGGAAEYGGDTVLKVTVFAPDFAHASGGHQPGRTPWRVGQEVASGVTYAGADTRETRFEVGVRERLPFTLTWRAGDGYSELSLDISR